MKEVIDNNNKKIRVHKILTGISQDSAKDISRAQLELEQIKRILDMISKSGKNLPELFSELLASKQSHFPDEN